MRETSIGHRAIKTVKRWQFGQWNFVPVPGWDLLCAFAARASRLGMEFFLPPGRGVGCAHGLVFGLSVGVRGLPSWLGRLGCFGVCAGIRAVPSCFERRPCAGRHLLFFAAAKKSRQKKAANTANTSSCLRAPNRSYASYGGVFVCVRCQRFEQSHHPLQTPVQRQAAAKGTRRLGGKLCVGCRVV